VQQTDVIVVKIWTTDEQLLLFRVYISPVEFHQAEDDGSIQYTLHEIQSTKVILAGDFNRHYLAWSKNQFYHEFMKHSVNFFYIRKLQWYFIGPLDFGTEGAIERCS
jgi:hypothetical protein